MNRWRPIIRIVVVGIGLLVTSAVVYYRATYPYGGSHCCILVMRSALQQYAEENGGKFPAGQTSPEASLSLLYKSNYIDAYTLRGMTVPEKKVRRILEGGGLFGPDSCGWHYVPGLTRADDSGIAILWCKEALGHNGQKTRDGGREIVFLGNGVQWISGNDWPAFLEQQEQLLQHRTAAATNGAPLVTSVIELPDGTLTNRLDGNCVVQEQSTGPDSSGSSTSSGTGLSPSELAWYQAPLKNGTVTRTLSCSSLISKLISDPVTVTFTNGVPDVTNVIFKMRSSQ
jgi:hypothetical protein